GLLVAAAHPPRRGERRRLGHAHQLEGQVAIRLTRVANVVGDDTHRPGGYLSADGIAAPWDPDPTPAFSPRRRFSTTRAERRAGSGESRPGFSPGVRFSKAWAEAQTVPGALRPRRPPASSERRN